MELMEKNNLAVENLKKDFKRNNVFHDVSATFESGVIYGVVGRNGSGKSVFFKILCGLMRPTGGNVVYNGKIIGKDMDYLSAAGIIIEHPNFLDDYSGYNNLKYLLSINGKYEMESAMKYVERLGLAENIHKKVKAYSLGMKQKLGMVQAVMEEQPVLILDEPFNGLDDDSVRAVISLLLELKEQGRIIILSSHIKEDMNAVADLIYSFNNFTLEKISAK
jgi:ABC-2 type transport system ATP-binding protein